MPTHCSFPVNLRKRADFSAASSKPTLTVTKLAISRMQAVRCSLLVLTALVLTTGLARSQSQTDEKQPFTDAPSHNKHAASFTPASKVPPGYVLGAGDQISIHVLGVDEISDKPTIVDLNGYIRIPLAGRIRASGLTLQQFESDIAKRLSTYVLHPDVSVSVIEFRSQPISVVGAVKNPGTQQVQGRKTLLEVLSQAGGIDSANAGSILKLTRLKEWGPIPLPNATTDPTNQFSIAQINLRSLMAATSPEENIQIKPNDVISVPRAGTVYVIGEVVKSGGFLLSDSPEITVLQALSMAGGLDKMAQPKHARILRRSNGEAERTEIPVNLTDVLEGKTPDLKMQSEDILFVPNNLPKRAAVRAIEAAVQMGTGIVIWGRP